MKVVRTSLLFILCFAFSFNLCQAQNSFGTILGVIRDQSDRAIDNAPVQILNTATGVLTTVRTQPDGNYTAINLIPGVYVVSADVQGFAKSATTPTQLVVNQTLRVDLVLHPGGETQTVQVTAEGALIDTDSSAISQEISSREVSDLPLANRNFMGLAVLSPGVVSDPGGRIGSDQTAFRSTLGGGSLYAGGGRGSSNGYLIDGVDNNDPGFQTLTITPSVEAIQDARLMNKDYSAEFGGSSSQFNLATKSGTNGFHGSAYEFLQNDALNAVTDFTVKNPVTGRYKSELRYNLFGVAAGGPILIPHVVDGRNKLFFFANYEGVRSHVIANGLGIFPTPAELKGDFSADLPIYDPSTGMPFPNNKITTIDPVAAKMIAAGLFPATAPTALPGINYIATLDNPDNIDQYNIRVDAHLGSKDSLFARFSASDENRTVPAAAPYGGYTAEQKGKNIAVDYTHIFSTNFINDLHLGVNRPVANQLQQGGGGSNNIAGSLFSNTPTNPVYWGAPYTYVNGYSTAGGPAVGPLRYYTTDARLTDVVTWIHGPHTLQAGLDVGKIRYKETDSLEARGLIATFGYDTANPANPYSGTTGNSFADLLLGDLVEAIQNQGPATGWFNSWGEGGFLQDNWKLGTRLTLNLGVRYDYQSPMREEQNRGSIVDLNYPGGRFLTANKAGVTAANSPLVAYTPTRDMEEPTKNGWSPRLGITFRPFGNTVIRTGYGIYYDSSEFNEYFFDSLNAPFSTSYAAIDYTYYAHPVKLDSLFPAASPTPVAGTIGGYTLYRGSRMPYAQQWNFDIEHELRGNMVMEIGYIGTEGTRLQDRRAANQKKLVTPGVAPGPVPYANFASLLMSENESSSNYNALFGRFEKRFSHGFSLLANYTYAKGLGTASSLGNVGVANSSGYMNAWNKKEDYGPLSYDIQQNFVFSPIWELPFGRGKMLASNAPGVVNVLIGGWEAAGIFTARTGFPFSITATDTSGTGATLARAQVIGNPWGPHAAGLAFNTAAFGSPAANTFGNSSNNMMRGSGLNNSDLSFTKNTVIHESLGFQLRADFFNLFNEGIPGPYPGYALATSSTFGKYLSATHAARSVQVSGKITF
jgi:hypothetical protein